MSVARAVRTHDFSTVSWDAYVAPGFRLTAFPARGVVLDVGCGHGEHLQELERDGHTAVGVDVDEPSLRECRRRGLRVASGCAEDLPAATASLDGILSNVALSYMDERRAVEEFARVLRPGGRAHLCLIGAGYYLRYLIGPSAFLFRVYGLRTLVNTWVYAATGRRLPGFLGDTIYQSERRLMRYYRRHGLVLRERTESKTFLGRPVFLYHAVEKAVA